ncbi:hypothetical protein [Krasilnikovia sp. MM14-A1259]|uniref:hypothetical protein n=1 Tax=Krasilnikovia sp. MM14-A1259 TaxID=3373539 RepID=UPI00382BC1D8
MTTSDPEQPMETTTALPPTLPDDAAAGNGYAAALAADDGAPVADDGVPVTDGSPVAVAAGPAQAGTVWDRLGPVTGVRWWRDAALGAVFEAEEAAAGMFAGLRRAAARRGDIVAELAARGARERTRGRQRANDAVQAAVTAFATSVVVDRVVDAQLERVLRPVVLAVLDDVLVLLEREPERIHSLIRGQRESMVDELITRVRTGAAAGDTAVDRITYRVFHRGPRPASADGR